MAKHAARSRIDASKTGASANAAPIEDLKTKARPVPKAVETHSDASGNPRTRTGSTRTGLARANGVATRNPSADDPMTRLLCEGFAEAARQAVREAHAEGLAVPARADGRAVEIRPNGEVVPIDDNALWSPVDWRSSARH